MLLIVEDKIDTARVFSVLLSKHGFTCKSIHSPTAALAFIRAHPPEQPLLVLLDQYMPEMTGIQLLEELRAAPRTAQVPVVLYSAGYSNGAEAKARGLGALAWVCKCCDDLDAFVATIKRAYQIAGDILGEPEENTACSV